MCFIFLFNCFYYSDADLPVVSSKDTQTDSTGDSNGSGDEKADDDKVEKKENVKQWSIDRIRKEYRKFNIDLAPKVKYKNIFYNYIIFNYLYYYYILYLLLYIIIGCSFVHI